jgi:hypothetical protein
VGLEDASSTEPATRDQFDALLIDTKQSKSNATEVISVAFLQYTFTAGDELGDLRDRLA